MKLVSIVGDFCSSVAPVVYHYSDKITEHIIIAEEKYINNAIKFKKGIKHLFSHIQKQKIYKLVDISPETLDIIIEKISPDENTYINTTDGLSFINSYLTYNLINKNTKFISYDIFENKIRIIGNNKVEVIEANTMSVEEHLKIKGFEIISREDKIFFINHSQEIISLFEKYFNVFLEFKKVFQNTRSIKHTNYKNVYKIFEKMKLINKSYNENYQLITGGLFEGYVFLKIKELGFDDVEVGVKIKNEHITNEFDILAMKNNHLNIIECKNKPYKKFDLEKLIYKYAMLRERIDYDAKAALISLENNYTRGYKKRAELYGLGLFGIEKGFENKLRRFLGV